MSLLSGLSAESSQQLQQFKEKVHQAGVLNETQKILFGEQQFIRFLHSNKYDIEAALQQFKDHIHWRNEYQIDKLVDADFKEFCDIKKNLPHGFFNTDKEVLFIYQGRPLYLINIGGLQSQELHDKVNLETLYEYFIQDFESAWREKIFGSQKKRGSSVEQMILIIDLKGSKIKDFTSKSTTTLFKRLLDTGVKHYPELVSHIFILNAPMFFENDILEDLREDLPMKTTEKIKLSGTNKHPQLLQLVDEQDLPFEYGGKAMADATCIYSDKGPWREDENTINYQEEGEEFKYEGDGDSDVDTDQINDLKNALLKSKNINIVQNIKETPGVFKNKFQQEDSEEDEGALDQLKAMLGKVMIDATPMNTQAEEQD